MVDPTDGACSIALDDRDAWACFDRAGLTGTILLDAGLAYATVREACLVDCHLDGADVRGRDLDRCTRPGASVRPAGGL